MSKKSNQEQLLKVNFKKRKILLVPELWVDVFCTLIETHFWWKSTSKQVVATKFGVQEGEPLHQWFCQWLTQSMHSSGLCYHPEHHSQFNNSTEIAIALSIPLLTANFRDFLEWEPSIGSAMSLDESCSNEENDCTSSCVLAKQACERHSRCIGNMWKEVVKCMSWDKLNKLSQKNSVNVHNVFVMKHKEKRMMENWFHMFGNTDIHVFELNIKLFHCMCGTANNNKLSFAKQTVHWLAVDDLMFKPFHHVNCKCITEMISFLDILVDACTHVHKGWTMIFRDAVSFQKVVWKWNADGQSFWLISVPCPWNLWNPHNIHQGQRGSHLVQTIVRTKKEMTWELCHRLPFWLQWQLWSQLMCWSVISQRPHCIRILAKHCLWWIVHQQQLLWLIVCQLPVLVHQLRLPVWCLHLMLVCWLPINH